MILLLALLHPNPQPHENSNPPTLQQHRDIQAQVADSGRRAFEAAAHSHVALAGGSRRPPRGANANGNAAAAPPSSPRRFALVGRADDLTAPLSFSSASWDGDYDGLPMPALHANGSVGGYGGRAPPAPRGAPYGGGAAAAPSAAAARARIRDHAEAARRELGVAKAAATAAATAAVVDGVGPRAALLRSVAAASAAGSADGFARRDEEQEEPSNSIGNPGGSAAANGGYGGGDDPRGFKEEGQGGGAVGKGGIKKGRAAGGGGGGDEAVRVALDRDAADPAAVSDEAGEARPGFVVTGEEGGAGAARPCAAIATEDEGGEVAEGGPGAALAAAESVRRLRDWAVGHSGEDEEGLGMAGSRLP
jgi:hypothetical protein